MAGPPVFMVLMFFTLVLAGPGRRRRRRARRQPCLNLRPRQEQTRQPQQPYTELHTAAAELLG